MVSRKIVLLIIGSLLISGLMAACGDTADFAKGAASLPTSSPASNGNATGAQPPSPANIPGQPTTTPAAQTKPTTPGSNVSVTKAPPTATPPVNTGATADPSNLDPCSLFTAEDFLAVFKKEADAPVKWEGVCDFEFAETLVPGSDEAFGLTIHLENKPYTPEKFTQMVQLLGTQKVDGIGDASYLKPSQSEDQSTDLFVLKGKIVFGLALLQPATVTASQRLDQLKAAALKVLGHLATAPASGKSAPTQPATSNSTPGPTQTPAEAGSGSRSGVKGTAPDPCKLFTTADFVAILNQQPVAPQKDEDVAAYSCTYQSATNGDTFSIYLQKETYDKTRFEAEWKDQPYTKTEPVKDLGDEAFWTDGPVSRLYVLKGNVAFWFELSLENDETHDQNLTFLKKGANKVLGLLN